MDCFDSQEEQLYLLELVVESLKLTPEKIHDCSDNPLLVKIKFHTLPIFVISQTDFKSVNSHNKTANDSIVFSSGRSCLFGKRPRDLVHEMQTRPLRIGVFCVGDTYPIAEMTLPLTGCLCDQIAMAMNDRDHLPAPYVLTGDYELLDPGKNSSGSLSLVLKITCLGKHVTTHYQMKENSFVFNSDRDEGQYSVKRVELPVESENYQHDTRKLDKVAEIHPESLGLNENKDEKKVADSEGQGKNTNAKKNKNAKKKKKKK